MAGLSPTELENYIGSILLRPYDEHRNASFCVVGKQPNAPEGLTVALPLPAPVIIRDQLAQVAGTGWAATLRHRSLYPELAATQHDPDNVLILRGVSWMANHSPVGVYAVGCHVFFGTTKARCWASTARARCWRDECDQPRLHLSHVV